MKLSFSIRGDAPHRADLLWGGSFWNPVGAGGTVKQCSLKRGSYALYVEF